MRKQFSALLTIATILIFSTQQASAAPVSLTLSLTTDSSLGIDVVAILGNGGNTFGLTGGIGSTLADAIDDLALTNDTTSINFDAGGIALSDGTISIIPGFIEAVFSGVGIGSVTSTSPMALTAGAPFTYTFDPGAGAPTSMSLDSGTLSIIAFGTPSVIDLGANPISFDIPPGATVASLTQTPTVTGNTVSVDVVMSVPLSFSAVVTTSFGGVNLNVFGAFVATGNYTTIIPVPEPSTLVLLGIALVGLIPVWRRVRK